jgi:hypothetical protein
MISDGRYGCAITVFCNELKLVKRKVMCAFITDVFLSLTRPDLIGSMHSSNIGGFTLVFRGSSQSFYAINRCVRQLATMTFKPNSSL